jgi:hypothetical protein
VGREGVWEYTWVALGSRRRSKGVEWEVEFKPSLGLGRYRNRSSRSETLLLLGGEFSFSS